MNLKKRLQHLADMSSRDRRTGRTTLIMKVAKDMNALVLAANHEHALHLQRNHGVNAKSIDTNLEGLMGPFIFDHYAVERLLQRAADKIESLEKEIEEMKEQARDDAFERDLIND
jgi:hypothetical protein